MPSRPSCTSRSTSRSSTGSTTTSGRWGSRRSSTCASRTRCSSRSGAATTSRACEITMAEDFGVEDRGHFYDPVGALRDVVVNHLMQVVAAAAMEAPSRGDPHDDQGLSGGALPCREGRPTRRTTCAASTTGTARSTGVAGGLDDRDVRGAPPRDRELALGRRAVLHPHRQASAGDADRAATGFPAPTAPRLCLRRARSSRTSS